MTPETAYAELMKFENRANPYPFFDELRKTPVARVKDGLYVVTGYRDIITLSHDPRVSSDIRKSPLAGKPAAKAEPELEQGAMESYGKEPNMIASDPPAHDRMRRQAMRQFGPPHSPDLIPKMEAECIRIVNASLDKVKGKARIDVVDDYAYPLPVAVICKILGVPLEDEPRFHAWIADMLGGLDLGPEDATKEGRLRMEQARTAAVALDQYMTGLIKRFVQEPGEGMLSKLVHDDGPDGPMSPAEALSNAKLLLIAGHDSTVNLISHCVLTILRDPGSSSCCAAGRS